MTTGRHFTRAVVRVGVICAGALVGAVVGGTPTFNPVDRVPTIDPAVFEGMVLERPIDGRPAVAGLVVEPAAGGGYIVAGRQRVYAYRADEFVYARFQFHAPAPYRVHDPALRAAGVTDFADALAALSGRADGLVFRRSTLGARGRNMIIGGVAGAALVGSALWSVGGAVLARRLRRGPAPVPDPAGAAAAPPTAHDPAAAEGTGLSPAPATSLSTAGTTAQPQQPTGPAPTKAYAGTFYPTELHDRTG